MAYEQHLSRGLQSAIDETPIEDGAIRFAVDEARLFLDLKNERIEFTDFIKGLTRDEVLALREPLPKMYLTADTYQFMMNLRGEWVVFGGNDCDKLGQRIDKTYIKDVKYNSDDLLVTVKGDGTEEVVASSQSILNRIIALEEKMAKIEIVEDNNEE